VSALNHLLREGKVFADKDVNVRCVLVSHNFLLLYNSPVETKNEGFSSTWMAMLAENLQTAKPYQMNVPVR